MWTNENNNLQFILNVFIYNYLYFGVFVTMVMELEIIDAIIKMYWKLISDKFDRSKVVPECNLTVTGLTKEV